MSVSPNPQPAPPPSQIVRFDDVSGQWRDDEGRDWSAFVPFTLPDQDVFEIDANASAATMQASVVPFAQVGTILFNMAVNPVSGRVYVTNTDARNHIRFEGHTPGFTSVRGHIADSRITVLDGVNVLRAAAVLTVDFRCTVLTAQWEPNWPREIVHRGVRHFH